MQERRVDAAGESASRISPTGLGMTGVAAAGLFGTHALLSVFQYSYLVRSGM
jgi:hypothetical protein